MTLPKALAISIAASALLGLAIQLRAAEVKMKSKDETSFGTGASKAGDLFQFQNFELKYEGRRELSEAELLRKQKANEAGIDGGDSMLAPTERFTLIQKSKPSQTLELGTLPYSRCSFEVDKLKFEIANAPAKPARWVLRTLK